MQSESRGLRMGWLPREEDGSATVVVGSGTETGEESAPTER